METQDFLVVEYSRTGRRRDLKTTGLKSTIMRNAQVDSSLVLVNTIEVFVKVDGRFKFLAMYRDGVKLQEGY